jgi:hypothetical protein
MYGCMSCTGTEHKLPVYFTRFFNQKYAQKEEKEKEEEEVLSYFIGFRILLRIFVPGICATLVLPLRTQMAIRIPTVIITTAARMATELSSLSRCSWRLPLAALRFSSSSP